MLRQVRCECGYLARGRSDDDVIALVLAHVAITRTSPRRRRLMISAP